MGGTCRGIGPDGLSAPADGDDAVVHAERPRGAGDPPTPILHPGIWIVQGQPGRHSGEVRRARRRGRRAGLVGAPAVGSGMIESPAGGHRARPRRLSLPRETAMRTAIAILLIASPLLAS